MDGLPRSLDEAVEHLGRDHAVRLYTFLVGESIMTCGGLPPLTIVTGRNPEPLTIDDEVTIPRDQDLELHKQFVGARAKAPHR